MDETYNIPIPIENIGCQELLEYKCSHCGWVRKRRNLKTLNQILSWSQAYVVLHEGSFYYFKNERARNPAGKFSLYGYNSVFRASEVLPKECPWAFKIVHSHREFKTYYFAAASEREMKTWMTFIKKEMLRANGRSATYGKVFLKEKDTGSAPSEDQADDSTFYQDIEQNIYDDSSKFIPTQDYTKKCSVKRENEDSDDEDLIFNPDIDNRPPCPIPPDRPKILSERPPLKPPRTVEELSRPQTPPRSRRPAPEPGPQLEVAMPTDKLMALQIGQELTELQKKKRRGSYEKTDAPGQGSPINPIMNDYRTQWTSGGGGSNGEDEPDNVEEYWNSIYFDDNNKSMAHDIIQAIGENGVYLVRPENQGTGKVLVVFACDQTKKYRIHLDQDSQQFYLAKEGYRSSSLEEMLYYYYENDLPTISQKLIQPYRLHPRYKQLNF